MLGNHTRRNQDMAYSDLVQHWFSLLDRGIEKRKVEERRWEINEAFEDMKQWMDKSGALYEGEGDQPTINKIGSYIRNYRAIVSYKNPGVKYTPRSASAWEMIPLPVIGEDGLPKKDPQTGERYVIQMTRAEARETLMTDIITKPNFGLRDTISRIVKGGCLGYGIGSAGYTAMFETALEKDTDDEVPVLEDGSLDFDSFITDPLTGMPMEDDNGKPIKKNRIPVWEEWFIDWVHYRHIIIDPDGSNDFMKHRWVAMEQIRTLEEVKKDPLFKNTKDLQESGTLYDDESRDVHARWAGDRRDDDRNQMKLVRLFHIYDFVKDRYVVLADGHGEALRDEIMPMGITHSPFAFFRPNERVDEFYPRPLVTDLVPLASENNEARRHLNVARKRGVRKVLAEKGVIDEGNMDALQNSEDMAVVAIDKVSMNGLDKTLHMLNPPPIGGDLYNNLNIISQDFDEVGGMSQAARGKASSGTATEANKMSQYEGTRYDFDREQLADCLQSLFEKLDDSIDANMTVPRAINISGTAGQLHQVLLDRDMIACDCDISVDITEMTPTDDEASAARMVQFGQMMGQNKWMARNEAVVRTMADRLNIKDENFIKGLVDAAEQEYQNEQQMMQMQSQMAQQSEKAKMAHEVNLAQIQQGKQPNAKPPSNSGEAAMQSGAGTQTPRDSRRQ